jgi:predicted nucleic acid-binding protein
MVVRVVDASAAAALLFAEPDADAVAARLGDARLVAPALFRFELANVCLLKCRRYPEQSPALIEAFRSHVGLGVEESAVDYDAAVELALATGLTAYDASYLWLSRSLGAELITLDLPLARAAANA